MRGVDISNYQAGLDLVKAGSAGIEFAICKLSEGRTYKDRQFDTFYQQAQACGLPLGAYVYSHATSPDAAIAEAKYALQILGGKQLALGIYMDVETNAQMSIPSNQLRDTVKAFCAIISAAGYRSGIYGSEYNLWARIRPQDFPNSIIWVAHYGKTPAFSCDIWQRSDSCSFPGYNGPVDMDEVMSERMKAIIKGENNISEPQDGIPDNTQKIEQSYDVLLLQMAMQYDDYWPGIIDGLNTASWREAFKKYASDVLGVEIK